MLLKVCSNEAFSISFSILLKQNGTDANWGQDAQGSTRKTAIEATQLQMSLDTAYVNRAGFLFFFVFVVQIFKHIYEVQEIKCKITY